MEVEVLPTVGCCDGVVHFGVELAESGDVGGGFSGVVEAVVGFGESFLAGLHDGLAMVVVGFADRVEDGELGAEV